MRVRKKKTLVTGGSLKRKGGTRNRCGMSGKSLHPDHEEFFTALGRRARELRKAKGWTFQDMVLLHGYHVSQWQKIEKGCPITMDSLLRMATVFETSIGDLLGALTKFPRGDAEPKEPAPVKVAQAKRGRSSGTKVTSKKTSRTQR